MSFTKRINMFNFQKLEDEFEIFIDWRTNLKSKNKLGDESIIFANIFNA